MLFLEAGLVKKYYAERLIFQFKSFKVYKNDRIGIVGQNGAGKSTLLALLAGDILPDEGFVKYYHSVVCVKQLAEDEKLDAELRLLKEFNLNDDQSFQSKSGGEKTRLKLAHCFSKEGLFLFDEPTTSLDKEAIALFKEKLSLVRTFILVSHDRQLLDEFCTKIVEIKECQIKVYNGNYGFYLEESQLAMKQAWDAYEHFMEEKNRLQGAIDDRKKRAKKIKKAPSRMGNSEARLHKGASREKQEKLHKSAKIIESRLKKVEAKERPQKVLPVKIDLSLTMPPYNKVLFNVQKLSFAYAEKSIFKEVDLQIYNGSKVCICGKNGVGKTTLLNLLYNVYRKKEANVEIIKAVNIVPNVKIGFFRQGFEQLEKEETLLKNILKTSVQNETTVRTILARLLFRREDVQKEIKVLSGGERVKAAFAKLIVSNVNVLFLDEPTNFLDISSMEALESVLMSYNGTVIFVSHDERFVEKIANVRLLINEGKIFQLNYTH